MEISGKIKILKETQTIGASGFRKREVVILTNEQYPQTLLIEFVQDKCELLNNFITNDSVNIALNLRGKEWQAPSGEIKYFNTLQGWRISKMNEESFIPMPMKSGLNNLESFETEDDFPF